MLGAAARAGATIHLMPAFGIGFSALFLSEYPQWFHFAGFALILVGVALSTMRRRNKDGYAARNPSFRDGAKGAGTPWKR